MIRMPASRLGAFAALVTLASFNAPRVPAQNQRPAPTPNDTLKSIEIAGDRRVTFRIYAPKASEVRVSGDFGAPGTLTRDDEGVWSRTVGPLEPDYYGYIFTVDGVRTVDPKGPMITYGAGGASVWGTFLVPGDAMDFEAARDVPHGDIRAVWYHCGTLEGSRRMHVYTPPGYEGRTEEYPVLYLLHGSGGIDSTWSIIGRAGFILDNLIAAKKALPMIVVMPNVSLSTPANLPPRVPGTPPSPESRAAMTAIQDRFTSDLMNDVIPFVEKSYRVKAGPEHRALAGLSMGGARTLGVVASHPDQFSYVGIWSAALIRTSPSEWEERHEAFLNAADKFNRTVKLLEIRCGEQDSLLPGSKGLAVVLEQRGIRHEFSTSGGGHTWINWRRYLGAFAPRLFQ
jgi:enterochelin esterase family protein